MGAGFGGCNNSMNSEGLFCNIKPIARALHQSIFPALYAKTFALGCGTRQGRAAQMAREKKHAMLNFRTQPALKESFDEAFALQADYTSITGYFEDCMRALVMNVRAGQRLVPPLQFVSKPLPAPEPAPVRARTKQK